MSRQVSKIQQTEKRERKKRKKKKNTQKINNKQINDPDLYALCFLMILYGRYKVARKEIATR